MFMAMTKELLTESICEFHHRCLYPMKREYLSILKDWRNKKVLVKELEFMNTTHVKFMTNLAKIFRVYGCGSRDVVSRWVRTALGMRVSGK